MQPIQSLWTFPIEGSYKENDLAILGRGGWTHRKFNVFSLALSCLTLDKYWKKPVLHTDELGETLASQLSLPYSEIITDLADLHNSYSAKYWVAGKLKTMMSQTKSYLHIDNDVYIFDHAFTKLEDKDVVCQNLTFDYPGYREMDSSIEKLDITTPSYYSNNDENIVSVNAGIIGGCKHNEIADWCQSVFSFIDSNREVLDRTKFYNVNMILDQLLFYRKFGNQITALFEEVDNEFTKVLKLHLAPYDETYVHLLGYAKKNILANEQIEFRLAYMFPQFYKKIVSMYNFSDCLESKDGRIERLFKCYDLLANKDKKLLLNTQFHLCKHIEILNNKLTNLNTSRTTELSGNLRLIKAFSHGCTINELVRVLPSENNESTVLKVVKDLVLDHAIYQDCIEVY